MGLGQGAPLLVEPACLLHDRGGLAEQDGIAREAKDEIGPASMGDAPRSLPVSRNDCRRGRGYGSEASGAAERTGDATKIIAFSAPVGRVPRPEAGGHQGVGGPFKNEQWQIAITLVVMVIEGEFLLSMGWVIRVIQVEHNRRRGLGVAGDEVVDERLRQAVEILAVHTVFETREGGGTRQVLGPDREATARRCSLQHGIVPETIGIIAVGIP